MGSNDNKRFLRRVAHYIANTGDTTQSEIRDISRTWMIFPNKRSIIFARTYLKDALSGATIMPKMMTLTAFMEKMSGLTEITEIEALFKLYSAYRDVYTAVGGAPDKRMTFDTFVHIGKMVLSDFNDVDAYMVDAEKIFINVKRYKEIKSYYLSEEQNEAITSLFGRNPDLYNEDQMWKHIRTDDTDEDIRAKFIRMWSILLDLYNRFTKQLTDEGYGLKGHIQRTVYQVLKDTLQFPFEKICFVGIDGSTTSIRKLFELMRDRHVGEFFWDTIDRLPDDVYKTGNATLQRLRDLVKDFPMPKDFARNKCTDLPEIQIISLPSKDLQAKCAGTILSDLQAKASNDRSIFNYRADNTAIIMPDTSLMTSMMYSINSKIRSINVTMGIPCRQTPFATLIRRIVSMHLNARITKDGKALYYRGDIEALSSNYYAQMISPKDCIALNEMLKDRQYTYDSDKLKERAPELASFFEPVEDDKNLSQVSEYFKNMLDTITLRLANTRAVQVKANGNVKPEKPMVEDTESTDDENIECVSSYELRILQAYRDAMATILDFAERYKIEPGEKNFFVMIERIFGALNINFRGTPLRGVQIMGVLESRNLDFDNVILLSANERVFPRRHLMHSIIPPNLRAAYELPTSADIESQYGYFLFRLLNCARRIYFIYDSRVGQNGSGEMSRYLLQMTQLLDNRKITQKVYLPKLQMTQPRNITIDKDQMTKELLKQFTTDTDNGGLKLSPSSLKHYLSCPLMFFLGTVCGFVDDDEVTPYISAATYGSIVHAIMEELFNRHKGIIDNAVIDNMLSCDIKKLAEEKIDEIYYNKRFSKNLNLMPGEGLLMAEIIGDLIREQLEKEKAKTPFVFKAAELDFAYRWILANGREFNFKGIIDRIDLMLSEDEYKNIDERRQNKQAEDKYDINDFNKLRFIDYKTGKDKRNVSNLDKMFGDNPGTRNDAIFQLLTYAHAFEYLVHNNPTHKIKGKEDSSWIKETEPEEGIKPELYLIRSSFTDKKERSIDDVKISNGKRSETIKSHKDENVNTFMERFEQLIDRIFDDTTPFGQTNDQNNCRYCSFLRLCDRKIKSLW